MKQALNVEFEKAVRLLVQCMPQSEEGSRKPVLFHGIRAGVYLYEREYPQDIVIAGVLHDILEDSEITEQKLREEFGENITRLVRASTKNDAIPDKKEQTRELIQRCAKNGEAALIVKAADILDSFKWYTSQNNEEELRYCMRNANALFVYKPDEFRDKIFDELRSWRKEFSYLEET